MASTSSLSRLRQDAGGRWLGYLPAYLWLGPLWVVTSLLVTPGLSSINLVALATLANIVGIGWCVLITWALTAGPLRHRAARPLPLWFSIGFGLLVGAGKGITTQITFQVLIGRPQLSVESIILGGLVSALLGAWLLPLVAVIYSSRQRYQDQRELLLREITQRQVIQPSSAHRTELIVLTNEATRIAATTRSASADDVATSLKLLIENNLRPLSHSMWNEATLEHSDFSFRSLLRLMYQAHRFSLRATLYGFVLLFALPQVLYAGWAEGLARTAVQCVVILVVLVLAGRITARSAPAGAVLLFSTNALLVVTVDATSTAIFGPLEGFPPLSAIFLLIAYFFISGLVFGVIRSAWAERDAIARQLREFEVDRLETESRQVADAMQRRALAQHLHSSVQNRVLGAVLRLSNEKLSQAELENEINDVVTSIKDLASPQRLSASQADLVETIAHIIEAWNGVIELRIETELSPDDTARVNAMALPFEQLLNEMVSNAVRHGQATAVRNSLSVDGHSLTIECVDNGLGVSGASGGLGSALYNSLAGAEWSLTNRAEVRGARLSLTISL